MTDSSTTPAPWWNFQPKNSKGILVFDFVVFSFMAALGIYRLASLLYHDHKLVFLLAPILLLAPLYLAWLAFCTVGVLRASRAQSGADEALQQMALDALRRYFRTAGVIAVVVLVTWGLIVHSW